VILGGRAQHRGPAHVDVLDRILVAAARARDRRGEGIEVDDQDVDGGDAMRAHDGIVHAGAAEQGAVHGGMQRLHAAVHDLGKASERGHLGHGEAGRGERARRAAGRDQAKAQRGELAGELDDAGLVGNREQRPAGVRARHLFRKPARIRAISCAGCPD
jgi:hypothetical protein